MCRKVEFLSLLQNKCKKLKNKTCIQLRLFYILGNAGVYEEYNALHTTGMD